MMAIVLNNDRAGIPSWFSGTNSTDPTMTSAEACQKWCSIYDSYDFFSYEWEYATTSASSSPCMTRRTAAPTATTTSSGASAMRTGRARRARACARGAGRRTTCSTCPSTSTGRVSGSHSDVCRDGTNSGTSTNPNAACGYGTGAGSPGGNIVYGGRSFSIWSWDPTKDYLDFVYDSDDIMELATMNVANGLCDGCTDSANWATCEVTCPFNSDGGSARDGFALGREGS